MGNPKRHNKFNYVKPDSSVIKLPQYRALTGKNQRKLIHLKTLWFWWAPRMWAFPHPLLLPAPEFSPRDCVCLAVCEMSFVKCTLCHCLSQFPSWFLRPRAWCPSVTDMRVNLSRFYKRENVGGSGVQGRGFAVLWLIYESISLTAWPCINIIIK